MTRYNFKGDIENLDMTFEAYKEYMENSPYTDHIKI